MTMMMMMMMMMIKKLRIITVPVLFLCKQAVLSNDLQELIVGGVTLGVSEETGRWHSAVSCPNLL